MAPKLMWYWHEIHFMLLVSFYTAWKHQKTRVYLMVTVGVEGNRWHKMGWPVAKNILILSKKRLQRRYFSVIFRSFKNFFFIEYLRWLLLKNLENDSEISRKKKFLKETRSSAKTWPSDLEKKMMIMNCKQNLSLLFTKLRVIRVISFSEWSNLWLVFSET